MGRKVGKEAFPGGNLHEQWSNKDVGREDLSDRAPIRGGAKHEMGDSRCAGVPTGTGLVILCAPSSMGIVLVLKHFSYHVLVR